MDLIFHSGCLIFFSVCYVNFIQHDGICALVKTKRSHFHIQTTLKCNWWERIFSNSNVAHDHTFYIIKLRAYVLIGRLIVQDNIYYYKEHTKVQTLLCSILILSKTWKVQLNVSLCLVVSADFCVVNSYTLFVKYFF